MTKVKNYAKFVIICLTLVVIALSVSFSSAYFKYKKQFTSNGELPILKIGLGENSSIESNITEKTYNLNDESFVVTLSTMGNNINGYVRVYVMISWVDGLSNTKLNSEGNLEAVCSLVYDETVWEIRGDETNGYYYYLKSDNLVEPDQEIELFNTIHFNNNFASDYQYESVEIVIIAEIYQATNKPANW